MVDSFEVTNVDWIVTNKSQNTKPLAAVGFSQSDITGNFSQFSGTFVVNLQHTCF